ncbi:hypothetical protein Zmor_014529 [Zophobas morio]|uniref:Pickpocket protein 28-like n=1 Tax=Zophobas morio TaxID=2755281 RepID=A0AA38IEX8_9CUCU|nr:hypothetical protein Zmor_014529 [Zophobas morio]
MFRRFYYSVKTKAIPAKNQNVYYKILSHLKEYGKISNIHGVHYLTDHRTKAEKIFWAILLLLSFLGCIFLIIQIWKKYEESPIVITFAPKDTEIYEIPFPAITVCPESKWSETKFNYSDFFYIMANQEVVSEKEIQIANSLYILCNAFMVKDNIFASNAKFIGSEFFDTIDELKPEFEADCLFMGQDASCSFVEIMTDQGLCYTYNLLDRKEMFREKVVHYKNWQLTHFSNFDEYYGYPSNVGLDAYPKRALMSGADNAFEIFLTPTDNDFICDEVSQGFKVLIHSPLDIPRLEKNYIQIPDGKAIIVAVEPELITTTDRVKAFDADTRGCYLKDEKPLKYFLVYTQSNCFLECVTNFTLNRCGCIDFYMPRENGTQICSGKKQGCVDSAEKEMKSKELERKIRGLKQKQCDCKPSCNILKYNVETSLSDVPDRYKFGNGTTDV